MTTEDRDTALFSGLVTMFHTAAMQQMGKIKNPATDKLERNLDQAQMSIDMLEMLARKTKGNLTDEERRFLSMSTQELKLNYVDEVAKGDQPSKETT